MRAEHPANLVVDIHSLDARAGCRRRGGQRAYVVALGATRPEQSIGTAKKRAQPPNFRTPTMKVELKALDNSTTLVVVLGGA